MNTMADTAFSATGAPAKAERVCFHCGLPLSATTYGVVIDGEARETCCRGCQAVVQAIVDHGLASYYRHRTALPQGQPPDIDEALAKLRLYDLPEVQRGFVHEVDGSAGGQSKEASLLLDGITCAACVWLIEQRLMRLEGVREVAVNYATRRARVVWDGRRIALSAILRAVADLGYGAQPYDSARSDDALKRERRT
ncbi:MAG: heavy metal translocating P-type ATPase metal-binding domain-containing protein, partial [Burkholderiales bacterium]